MKYILIFIQSLLLLSSCFNNNKIPNFIQKPNNIIEVKIHSQRGSMSLVDKDEIEYFLSTFNSPSKKDNLLDISKFSKNGSIHFIKNDNSIQIIDIDTEINCYRVKINNSNYHELLTYRTSRYIAEM